MGNGLGLEPDSGPRARVCSTCREAVKPGATVCPHCRAYIGSFLHQPMFCGCATPAGLLIMAGLVVVLSAYCCAVGDASEARVGVDSGGPPLAPAPVEAR